MANSNKIIEMNENDYDARELLEPLYKEAALVKQRVLFPVDQAQEVIDQIIQTCESEGKRFYDYFFPPSAKSIYRYPRTYMESSEHLKDCEWKRFSDMHDDPGLFVKKIQPGDIVQGSIGNCYMIAAISSFAQRPDLVQEAFYPTEWNAAGVFGVKIWIEPMQEWRMVILDDYFPVFGEVGEEGLVFAYSKTKNEAWSSLMEKAIAKINGSYLSLSAGYCHTEPLPALTGQKIYSLQLGTSEDSTFEAIQYYCSNGGIVQSGGGATLEDGSYVTVSKEEGLVQGHAYSVLDAVEISGFRLIKLRNPWGDFEWNGDWSDESDLWNQYPEIADACKHKKSDNGIFWMSLSDFYKRMESPDVVAIGFDHLPNMHELGGNWNLDNYIDFGDECETITEIKCKQVDESNTGDSDLKTFPQYELQVTKKTKFFGTTKRVNADVSGYLYGYVFPQNEEIPRGRIIDYSFISDKKYLVEINDFCIICDFVLDPGFYTIVLYVNECAHEESILKIWTKDKLKLVEIPSTL